MNADFTFALYVFCMDYHEGQGSRLYRIMSRIVRRGIRISDGGIRAIHGNRHSWKDGPMHDWTVREQKRYYRRQCEEWDSARKFYRELKRKYGARG